ncbi:MotA/TolQ/ExbB proton channel family protein [Hydrogenimonas cancrithermarum]|uniref:Flagellar motor protein MotA n=1 Tax=Hydrogenimonas cancrithermarum TaxID=2993563 RepID=A0ABM8FJ71_9BACT|nr:MotA/TolQ/ExbB proton channel family protein [Hydrogenimonas cancrithermarum]BDY12338.1 flagellar motor protein MotA [Hydrogenimonas cancrithermarum]
MIDIVVGYLDRSSPITIGVLGLLSFYLLLTLWAFVYRYLTLARWLSKETDSMEQMHMGAASVSPKSILKSCMKKTLSPNANMLEMCQFAATKEATKGLTLLSLIASTSPFIGLFGTVISILEAFAGLGTQKSATLSVVAPAISEALVATAAGIFVAIFAYTFHLLLKRKAYELSTVIAMQVDLLLAQSLKKQ